MILAREASLPYSDDMTNRTDQTSSPSDWSPTSRNTCPEPGCDEPRSDQWGGCCDRHRVEERV
jgi:hypothetical protein